VCPSFAIVITLLPRLCFDELLVLCIITLEENRSSIMLLPRLCFDELLVLCIITLEENRSSIAQRLRGS